VTVFQATSKVTPVESEPRSVTLGLFGVGGGVDGTEAAVTEKVRLPDVPPPGAGVFTVTGIEPAAARSDAESVARSTVLLTNVVGRVAPFQRTTEVLTNPLPFTVSVRLALPATAPAGDSELIAGTGGVAGEGVDVAGRAGTDRALQA
jgi:hypothetical protein